jgi:hypothetical protein
MYSPSGEDASDLARLCVDGLWSVAGEEVDGGFVDQLHGTGVEGGSDCESRLFERLVDVVGTFCGSASGAPVSTR